MNPIILEEGFAANYKLTAFIRIRVEITAMLASQTCCGK